MRVNLSLVFYRLLTIFTERLVCEATVLEFQILSSILGLSGRSLSKKISLGIQSREIISSTIRFSVNPPSTTYLL